MLKPGGKRGGKWNVGRRGDKRGRAETAKGSVRGGSVRNGPTEPDITPRARVCGIRDRHSPSCSGDGGLK
jgi:hypothetical protein